MLKSLIFAVLAFSSPAFAQNVTIQLIPANPVIISSDFTFLDANNKQSEIKGPWFQANMLIINTFTEEVSLSTQELTIQMANGGILKSVQPMPLGTVIPANSAAQVQGYYSLFGLTDVNGLTASMVVIGTTASGAPFTATVAFTPAP